MPTPEEYAALAAESATSSAAGAAIVQSVSEELQALRTGAATFPSSPIENQRAYRSDRGIEYRRVGTRWLSTGPSLVLPLTLGDIGAQPIQASSSLRMANPYYGLYNIFVERFLLGYFISTGASANNYFTAQLRTRAPAGAATLGASVNTQNKALTTWDMLAVNVNSEVASTIPVLEADFTETGTSITYISPLITYRLVG